jgi:hypothetical protein
MRTRNERRRDNHDLTVFLLLCAAGLTALLLRSCGRAERESTPIAVGCAAELTYAETQEDPLESEAIEAAVLAVVGTEYEEDAFGYSFTELAKIISAEGGEDYDTCWYVATCLMTAQLKTGLRFTPTEVADMQRFADPADTYTEEAYNACVEVFLRGNRAPEVKDATVFHCLGRGNTNYHDGELCEWVAEHNGVDYYTELKNWGEEVAKWQSRSE